MTKNKSFSNGTSSIDQTKLLMKMFNEKSQVSNRSDINSVERPQTQCQEAAKPIQKLIKSGSQVLGKQRSRPNLTRKEILKQMTDKNNTPGPTITDMDREIFELHN